MKGFYFGNDNYCKLFELLVLLKDANPDWPAVYHYLGKLSAKFDKHFDAVSYFEKAVELNALDDAIFCDLGLSAIQAKEYRKAESAFRKADELSIASSPMYLSKLGASLMLQKYYDEAIETQYKALELNDRYPPAYYQLGLTFNILGRYEKAIPMFERAIELGDKNPNTQKHLATARSKL